MDAPGDAGGGLIFLARFVSQWMKLIFFVTPQAADRKLPQHRVCARAPLGPARTPDVAAFSLRLRRYDFFRLIRSACTCAQRGCPLTQIYGGCYVQNHLTLGD